MKNRNVLLGVMALTLTGCAVDIRGPVLPPPPVVNIQAPGITVAAPVVTIGVPDAYVWDGYEYVGFIGGQYMYLGPGGAWLVCDSVRLGRFHGYERLHPDWRAHAVRNAGRDARGHAAQRHEEEKR
jgi:hypothetical protein